MNNNRYFISGYFYLCLAAFMLLFNCEREKVPSEFAVSSGNQRAQRAILADGFIIQYQPVEQSISATGNLIPYEAVEVRPERAGKLVSLDFKESTYVKEGTQLGQIDDSDLTAQLERLKINLELAEKEVARGEELLKIQGISQEEVDRLTNRVADIRAEMNIIDVQVDRSKITAPFSGMLGLRQVSEGAYITPNNVLVELQQVNPIKVEFDVPERNLQEIKKGQALKFTIEGSDEVFDATVYAIGSAISPVTRTFKVRATAPNPNGRLKPGQFAKVTVVTGINEEAILVPTDAVVPVLDGQQIYVVRNGRAIATPVATTGRKASEVEITGGIQAGDTILVSGLLSLTDGVPVQVNKVVKRKNP